MVDKPRCLIAGEWVVLEPLAGGSPSCLIARARGGCLEPFTRKVPVIWPLRWSIAVLIERGPSELLHHYVASGMLLGIKARVDAGSPEPAGACGPGPMSEIRGTTQSRQEVTWATLGWRSRAWRVMHAAWSVAQLWCLGAIWVSVLMRRRSRRLWAGVAFLFVEGGCAHCRPRRLPDRADAGGVG